MTMLQAGAAFPHLEIRIVGDGTLGIPEDLHDHPAVLLFYRGHW